MTIISIFILSNDYVVKIKTNGIQVQASLHDFMDVELLKSGFLLKTGNYSTDLKNEDLLVQQVLNNYKSIGEQNDPSGWSILPTVVEKQGPPPPTPPVIKEYTVEGRVADKETQEPIKGIKVYISSSLPNDEDPPQDEKIGFETKTDEEGNWELTFKIKTEEVFPDVFSILETPNMVFESEDMSYSEEKRKPYAGDNSLKTVKSSLDIVQMKVLVPDLKKETTKIQNIGAEEIDKIKNIIPKDPFQALQKAVSSKIQDILKKFIPLIIGMIAEFGISKLTEALKNGFKSFNKKNCPDPAKLRKLIKKRNRIVKILNAIFKFVDALVKVAGGVLSLIQIFKLVKSIVVSLPIPQAVGVPPAKDGGGLASAQTMGATLRNADNIDKFNNFITKYEGLTIMVLAILTVLRAVLKMAIDLLKGLDGMIQQCAEEFLEQEELTLEEINSDLLESLEEGEEEVQLDPFLNGFDLFVVPVVDSKIGSINRRQAIAKNKDGVIILKGDPSFSASDQILIDELKFYIRQNNLKAF